MERSGPLTGRARLRWRRATSVTRSSQPFRDSRDPILPQGFVSKDIGAVGAAGKASFAGGTWTVEGLGRDIWNHRRRVPLRLHPGGPAVLVHGAGREPRESEPMGESGDQGSRRSRRPGRGTSRCSRRLAPSAGLHSNGVCNQTASSVHTSGPAIAPSMWLRSAAPATRSARITGCHRRSRGRSSGTQTVTALHSAVYVGLAVSSHVDGELATARFDNVAFERGNPLIRTEDVGNVGLPGSTDVRRRCLRAARLRRGHLGQHGRVPLRV